jgi:hypothetical protein
MANDLEVVRVLEDALSSKIYSWDIEEGVQYAWGSLGNVCKYFKMGSSADPSISFFAPIPIDWACMGMELEKTIILDHVESQVTGLLLPRAIAEEVGIQYKEFDRRAFVSTEKLESFLEDYILSSH